jgi:iron complex outermembrane receptor protein
MKKRALMLVGIAISGSMSFAQKVQNDSLKQVNLQEVEIVSTRATAKTPMAFTNISKDQISKQNSGVDIIICESDPSSYHTQPERGTGYNSLRIRGTEGTRINVRPTVYR